MSKARSQGASAAPVYPGKAWVTREPAEVGLDRARLEAFRDFVGGRGCIVRHGYMVYGWGDQISREDVASAAKPWYSYFLLRAIEEGRLPNLDAPVLPFEPRLRYLNRSFGYKDRRITWRELAYQTSCYGVHESPGTAFDYNDWQMALLFDTLFLKVYGATWDDVDRTVLHPGLTDVLQCQDNPTFMAFGTGERPGRLAVSPRDFARFGLLYLRGGLWRDHRLLSAEHAHLAVTSPLPPSLPRTAGEEAEMIPGQRTIGSEAVPDNQCDHVGSYSLLWWVNGIDRNGRRNWPDAPPDTYGAFGHGGLRAMVVMPSLDLIVSWNDTNIDTNEAEGRALGLLAAAVQQGAASVSTH